jgi:hypothetical protein
MIVQNIMDCKDCRRKRAANRLIPVFENRGLRLALWSLTTLTQDGGLRLEIGDSDIKFRMA